MYVRKHRNKWQCHIRFKGMRIAESFTLKSSALCQDCQDKTFGKAVEHEDF